MKTNIAQRGSMEEVARRSVSEYGEQTYITESYALMPLSALGSAWRWAPSRGGVAVGMVCRGTAKLVINGCSVEVHRYGVFFLDEGSCVDAAKYSKACDGYVVYYSESFLERIFANISEFISVRAMLGGRLCRELSPRDASHLHNIIIAVLRVVEREENPYKSRILSSLFSSLFYTIASVVGVCDAAAEEGKKMLRSESLYNSFMRLLAEKCTVERSVEYYADCLGVTPKYLSAVCRRHAHKGALKLIDQAVVRRAKELLLQAELSVQEVAKRMNFASQSFFGKYFKQRVGISPSRYKIQA